MNQLAELPSSISGLTALSQLALSINPLRRLPPGLAQLGGLAMLELYYVQLDVLGELQELRRALPR
jgi:Leucine-rich repeat (LRR) protein